MTRVAIVTGVGRVEGIGFEVCRQLAAEGFTVLLSARRQSIADSLAAQLAGQGNDVRGAALDVTNVESVAELVARVESDFGHVDVLINNAAGVTEFGQVPSTANLDAARSAMDVTLFGTWRTTQLLLPLLRRSPSPRVVNVSSGAGSHDDVAFGLHSGNGMGPGYGIAKAALNALTDALAFELRDTPVIVNAVCPGFTATFPGGESMGARPVRDGAASVMWAVRIPDDGPRGGFYRDGKPLPW